MKKQKTFDELWENLKQKDDTGELEIGEIVSDFVSKLVSIRYSKGFSQRDLAEMTGIKQSAIARMESMSSIPRLDTIAKIAHALDVRIELLGSQKSANSENIEYYDAKKLTVISLSNSVSMINETFSKNPNYSVDWEDESDELDSDSNSVDYAS